jgi:hypothetical protein
VKVPWGGIFLNFSFIKLLGAKIVILKFGEVVQLYFRDFGPILYSMFRAREDGGSYLGLQIPRHGGKKKL